MPYENNQSGILVSVYRQGAKNPMSRRLSDEFDMFTLILPNGGPFSPCESRPAIKIVERRFKGVFLDPEGRPIYHAVSAEINGDGIGRVAFGGNFIYSSDTRFGHDGPIKIHDQLV